MLMLTFRRFLIKYSRHCRAKLKIWSSICRMKPSAEGNGLSPVEYRVQTIQAASFNFCLIFGDQFIVEVKTNCILFFVGSCPVSPINVCLFSLPQSVKQRRQEKCNHQKPSNGAADETGKTAADTDRGTNPAENRIAFMFQEKKLSDHRKNRTDADQK
jgi:hypothetical protein